MGLYRCFVFDKAGIRPGSKRIQSETDAHARGIALDFLRDDPLMEKMEVWRESGFAFRVSPNQARLEGFVDDRNSPS
jgi:hypothetical protein